MSSPSMPAVQCGMHDSNFLLPQFPKLIHRERCTLVHLPWGYRKIRYSIIYKVLGTVPGTSSSSRLKVETEEQMLLLQHILCSAPGRCKVLGAKKKGCLTQPAASEKSALGEGYWIKAERRKINILSTEFLVLGEFSYCLQNLLFKAL